MKLFTSIILFTLQQYRGNSRSMESVPDGINFWLFKFVVVPVCSIVLLIMLWNYLTGYNSQEKFNNTEKPKNKPDIKQELENLNNSIVQQFEQFETSLITNKYYNSGELQHRYIYRGKRADYPDIMELYYKNGNLKTRTSYQIDFKDGPFETFYENGQPKFKCFFVFNIIDKYFLSYYQNGKIKEKIIFNLPYHDGFGESYYENGILKQKAIYKNEEDSGIGYNEYFKVDKMITVLGMYINGKRSGTLDEYDEKGGLIRSTYFEDGINPDY